MQICDIPDPRYYGFTEKDLDRKFSLGPGILLAFSETENKNRNSGYMQNNIL